MLQVFLVAAGGAIGAVLRYLTGLFVVRLYGKSKVITGTVVANCFGCFLAGIFFSVIQGTLLINDEILLFLSVGVLGSYTTFSSFTLEFVRLAEISFKKSVQYLFIQLVIAIGMVFLGYALTMTILGVPG